MRFMMLMYPNRKAEEGVMPNVEEMSAMMKFNEELAKAGALISLDGLHPTSKGARVRFNQGKVSVTDGPFAEAKEVIGGYWIVQFASKQEAIDWIKRCPALDSDMIEIRQIFELSDFPAELQERYDSQFHAKKS